MTKREMLLRNPIVYQGSRKWYLHGHLHALCAGHLHALCAGHLHALCAGHLHDFRAGHLHDFCAGLLAAWQPVWAVYARDLQLAELSTYRPRKISPNQGLSSFLPNQSSIPLDR